MFHKLLVLLSLLVFLQNFKSSFSSPLQSFDVFDLGLEEKDNEQRRSERQGQCPAFPTAKECPSQGEYEDCNSDEDCSLPKKCCSDGCSKICIDPEDDTECKDLRDDCDSIPLKGDELTEYCERWKKDRAVSQCRKTCGWCKAPFPTDCEDKRDCQWIINNAGHYLSEYCEKNKNDPAVKACPKTCGFCRKIPSPTIFPSQSPAPQTPPKVTANPGVKPGPKPTKPDVQLTGFLKECLDAHNKYRAIHGSLPLKWSAELTNDAQAWANHLARENEFRHYPELKELDQGENLLWFSPPRRKCNGPSDENCVHCGEIVKDWYDEIVDYDFSQGRGNTPYDVVTHFTQVVWKGTTELGMATAVAHNRLVAVARYRKAGNIGSAEEFKKNVLMPLSFP